MQQEHEFNSGSSENAFTEEKGRTGGSAATSVVTAEEITSLHCPPSWFLKKVSAQHSQSTDLTELDSQSILTCFDFLSQCICFKVTTGSQEL